MEDYLVALVTAPSMEVARDIARALLNHELAACVNIVPSVTSLYVWDGELCTDEEVLLLIKTKGSAFDPLASTIKDVHPYDVPEIIAMPIAAGAEDYLSWIEETVTA